MKESSRSRLLRSWGLVTAFAGLGSSALAATIWVPDDHPTIQDAIQAAAAGDEIVVRAGTYFENLDYLSKNLVVRSESGPAVTIIDGSQPQNPDQASTVTMNGNGMVLAGFSITGGGGSKVFGATGPLTGGGIVMLGTGAIRDNWIYENHVVGDYVYAGGGVYVHDPILFQISGNLIYRNSVVQTSGTFSGFGGGIAVRTADGVVFDNIIWDNTVGTPGGDSAKGGGVGTQAICDAHLRSNVIACNHASQGGGIGGTFREISGNSIVRNDTSGIVGGTLAGAAFFNNDISENTGVGMSCPPGGVGSCNNFWGNTVDDPDCYGVGTDNNTSNDPQYSGTCEDLCVAPTSPLLPENDELGCGQIGALVACASSSVEDEGLAGLQSSLRVVVSPNPARGRADLRFRSLTGRDDTATIEVYDLQGRLVRSLGKHAIDGSDRSVSWDGMDEAGRAVASGSYVVLLRTEDAETTARMLILR
ncbi:MAG: FlgD immunoglobulin-like domain containing protein [Candidatus Eisenbacteria bacterium]|uniref:T9SS type A sorting domain-containing protein n=1 Tax=Eiseniibacteriota bacterium TaxID=2212470 RepID=A0A956RNS0_UNCEI|nr:T9SS type A sorting domain-containing protein [Candidatus Eisenbacteria bacterium]